MLYVINIFTKKQLQNYFFQTIIKFFKSYRHNCLPNKSPDQSSTSSRESGYFGDNKAVLQVRILLKFVLVYFHLNKYSIIFFKLQICLNLP